ncbi:hypothetical protein [Mongoliitalea daihaiensis]|uniref:hypothetical protein n=1 Tax=Mongoliitalea daihaiensis TaxID=2782006 RepID=UPI001F487845|nr:hypothetical protein [Mongoliitalea daihaiensis]UJP64734.1 hypothetical protein IPZ59_18375 [Mongoliitalea daihaiensis]UJP64751.1 hypothetical protein IPZ59_18470 [Mongoliitalea daihaiensis]
MNPRIYINLIIILIAGCRSTNSYENEEVLSLSETLPNVFESFHYSNYCLWVELELIDYFDTIPFVENNNSAKIAFEKIIEDKCKITHYAEFDGRLISLPDVIKKNSWMININDTRDMLYFDLTSTTTYNSLNDKFIGCNNLNFNQKYKISPIGFDSEEEESFKFRPEISRVSFNDSLTKGFYFLTVWKDGDFQQTGTSTLVLIEKERNNWVVKEIKYFRKN